MHNFLRRIHRRTLGRLRIADRDAWIRDLVPGRTFADVGGLWGTVNEKVTVAARAGASAMTMVDVQPAGNRWWQAFEERCRELSVADCRGVVADICKATDVKALGRFDVVHCSGIMYHVPDVLGFLRNLHRITGQYLILTSMVVPPVVRNAAGTLRLPAGAMLSVPGMDPGARAVLRRHFTALDVTVKDITEAAPAYLDAGLRFRTGPWWWLYTPATMKSLAAALPFTVEDEGWSVADRTYSLLLRARPGPGAAA